MKTKIHLLAAAILQAAIIHSFGQPGSTVQLSDYPREVAENAGTVTITVFRTGDSTGTVTVDYATSDGTARAGLDYTAATGTVVFGPGETYKTFTVPILDDGLAESDETVNLALSNPTG